MTKKDLKALKKYVGNIVELDLGNTNFNDGMASMLEEFENVIKLQLSGTEVGDESLKETKKMENLESLNLFGTKITDVGLLQIGSLPNLKELHVKSRITAKGLAQFVAEYPSVDVNHLDKSLFAHSKLTALSIKSATDFLWIRCQ